MGLRSYSVETSQGPFLAVNEDNHGLDLKNRLFFILDGIGGSGIGDRCTRMINTELKHFFNKMGKDADATMPFFYNPRYLIETNALVNALIYVHKKIYEENLEKPLFHRAAASGAFVLALENLMIVVSIGNCSVHLLRRGTLEKVLIEESFKSLSREDRNPSLTSFPTNALGMFEQMTFNVSEMRAQDGDTLALMTDGVYCRLRSEEIHHTLESIKLAPTEKIKNLFTLSNERGNLDNQTMMVLNY